MEDIIETYELVVKFRAFEYQEGQHVPNLEPWMLLSLNILIWFNYVVFDGGKAGSRDNSTGRGPYIKSGDIICLLEGFRESLLLRESTESDTYELITRCSVLEVVEEYYMEDSARTGVPFEPFSIV